MAAHLRLCKSCFPLSTMSPVCPYQLVYVSLATAIRHPSKLPDAVSNRHDRAAQGQGGWTGQISTSVLIASEAHVGSSRDTCQFQQKHMSIPAEAHVHSGRSICQFQQKHMSVPAEAHVDSSRGTCQFQQKHMSIPAEAYVDSSRSICQFQQKHMSIPAEAHVGSRRYTCRFQQNHIMDSWSCWNGHVHLWILGKCESIEVCLQLQR